MARIDNVVEVEQYLADESQAGSMRLVDGVESLIDSAHTSLGRLRERVNRDRDNQVRVVLLSRRPRVAYPDVPGSSVLRDAKVMPPPRYGADDDHEVEFGFEATEAGTPAEVVLAQAIRELGEAACAGLDALVYEDGEVVRELKSLDEPLQDALQSSGLVELTEGVLSWTLVDPWARVQKALADVIAGMRVPQADLAPAVSQCWAIERLVKHALRARARVLWADEWTFKLLDAEVRKSSFLRAGEGAYAGAEAFEELRDPLEWLTLTETLSVRMTSGVGTLGLSEPMWKKLASELLPVKDRIDRSQLLRKHDAATAHRWLALLSERLSTSGSRPMEEAIAASSASEKELLEQLRSELSKNPRLTGDIAKDCMALALATVRFLAHTLDTPQRYTSTFMSRKNAPKERQLQDAFKTFLDASDLAGRAAVEVSSIGAGRADVVLYLNDGARYVTEVKRDFTRTRRDEFETAYLSQSLAYQVANVPFSQLLILDLTADRDIQTERLEQSVWVTHRRDIDGAVLSTALVAVVRGNRPVPSARKR
jgi:hypothetical protein